MLSPVRHLLLPCPSVREITGKTRTVSVARSCPRTAPAAKSELWTLK